MSGIGSISPLRDTRKPAVSCRAALCTPVVTKLQLALIPKGNPRSSTSCYVNFFDVAIQPNFRCSARSLSPPLAASKGAAFLFGSEA